MSDIISILALAVSIFAAFTARKAFKSKETLNAYEIEILRRQIQSSDEETRKKSTSDISARLFPTGRNSWSLKIWNNGPASAHNVDFVSLSEGPSFFLSDGYGDRLPLETLEKGGSISLIASVSLGDKPKERIRLSWNDPTGEAKTKEVEVTL